MPDNKRSTLPSQVTTAAVAGALLSGLLLSFYPTFRSGFRAMQADPLDSRLINYILEHSYLWVAGDPLHQAFWSPPVFYPALNTAAYSETFLGTAPVYWVYRLVGVAPEMSYQWWLITLSALNFLVAYIFLRHALAVGVAGGTAGAWLIAFGSPRTQQLLHAQLIPVFFILIVLYGLRRILAEPEASGRWVAVFFACVTIQLYTSFYVAWFLIFGLCIGTLLAMASVAGRSRLAAVAREQYGALVGCSVLTVLLVAPMVLHYLEATRARGYRDFAEVSPMLIRSYSWLYMGPGNWLYGGLAELSPFAGLPMEHEHRLGVGLVTACAAALGLFSGRRNPGRAGRDCLSPAGLTGERPLPGHDHHRLRLYCGTWCHRMARAHRRRQRPDGNSETICLRV